MKMKPACCLLPLLLFAAVAPAQDDLNAAEKQFQDTMADVTLVGYSTSGDKPALHDDRYVIEKVSKVKDDLWKFDARIQYNQKDFKMSMNLPVKFAGDTPVISLTDFAIPGLGTYTARVVIYKDAYAGTWSGGTHGGKMFGSIVKNKK